jgi:tetratricopeptide (TPR) repeat protein
MYVFIYIYIHTYIFIYSFTYRMRENGEKIDNSKVDVLLHQISFRLGMLYQILYENDCSSVLDYTVNSLRNFISARTILNPWSYVLDNNTDLLEGWEPILELLLNSEGKLCLAYVDNKLYEKAEPHAEKCLVYARRFVGEKKVIFIYMALKNWGIIRAGQGRAEESREFFEEAYQSLAEVRIYRHVYIHIYIVHLYILIHKCINMNIQKLISI